MESSWAGERWFGVLQRVVVRWCCGELWFGGAVESSGLGMMWRVPGLESNSLWVL